MFPYFEKAPLTASPPQNEAQQQLENWIGLVETVLMVVLMADWWSD